MSRWRSRTRAGPASHLTQLLTGGRVPPIEVARRLEERPPRRYRRALAGAVRLVRDGVQSVLEELYAVEVEEAHGLPKGDRQSPHVVDGVTLFEDVVYDSVGVALTVRLDGRTHLIDSVAFRDRRRDNAAELAVGRGWSSGGGICPPTRAPAPARWSRCFDDAGGPASSSVAPAAWS